LQPWCYLLPAFSPEIYCGLNQWIQFNNSIMKKNILQTLVLLIFVVAANAQQGINYKAIINDANGDALVNTMVTIQFTILESGIMEVYKETHTPTTDANGIVIVNIGEGTVVSGVFNDIDWGSNPHFLKTEIDKGDGLTDMGTTEFKTVPYALSAKTAGNTIDLSNFRPGDILQYNGDIIVPAVFSFYYQDNDGDGYGNENVFVYSPVKPAGFVETDGDSDDSDINVNPDADENSDIDGNPDFVEICGDGIDNNYNGEIDEVPCSIEEMVNIDEFWIDRFEASIKQISTTQGTILAAATLEGSIPVVGKNQLEAAELCAYAGKRLCTDEEWLRACQGPEGFTYPYGNVEILDACNGGAPNDAAILLPTGNSSSCGTFEGVMDMVGNVGEWTADPSGTFRGGNYIEAVINGPGCLYRTTAYSVYHSDQKTGFRCCADELPTGVIEYKTPGN
jgi:hypothetical protein